MARNLIGIKSSVSDTSKRMRVVQLLGETRNYAIDNCCVLVYTVARAVTDQTTSVTKHRRVTSYGVCLPTG